MILDIDGDPMDFLVALRNAQACTVESSHTWAEKLPHLEILQRIIEEVEKQVGRTATRYKTYPDQEEDVNG